MQDGVIAKDILNFQVADVLAHVGHLRQYAASREGALTIKVTVAANHAVAGLRQHWSQYGTDVAKMAGDENSHLRRSQVAQGRFPDSHISSSLNLSRSVSMHAQKPVCWNAISCPSLAKRSIGECSNIVSSPSI